MIAFLKNVTRYTAKQSKNGLYKAKKYFPSESLVSLCCAGKTPPRPHGWCPAYQCWAPARVKPLQSTAPGQYTFTETCPALKLPVLHRAALNMVGYSFRVLCSEGVHLALAEQKLDLYKLVTSSLLIRRKFRLCHFNKVKKTQHSNSANRDLYVCMDSSAFQS